MRRLLVPVSSISLFALLSGVSTAQVVLVEDFENPDTANCITFNAGQSIVTAWNTWSVTATGVDLAGTESGQAGRRTAAPDAGRLRRETRGSQDRARVL